MAHTSFDLNGRHGAIPIDLGKPCTDERWHHRFDIVTNAGTSEHIELLEAQYECFRNVHHWLRPGGIAVHCVPDIRTLEAEGAWEGHCCNYYSLEFFELLAEQCGYDLVHPEGVIRLICVGLRKSGDAPFACDRQALLDRIARRESGRVYKGINDGSALNRLLLAARVRVRKAVARVQERMHRNGD